MSRNSDVPVQVCGRIIAATYALTLCWTPLHVPSHTVSIGALPQGLYNSTHCFIHLNPWFCTTPPMALYNSTHFYGQLDTWFYTTRPMVLFQPQQAPGVTITSIHGICPWFTGLLALVQLGSWPCSDQKWLSLSRAGPFRVGVPTMRALLFGPCSAPDFWKLPKGPSTHG